MTAKATEYENYYVPEQSKWPIIASVGVFLIAVGAGLFIQQNSGVIETDASGGGFVLLLGFAIIVMVMFGWFADTIRESLAGKNSRQMDISYRMGMMWFIGSEVMFFAAFFGALFYARLLSVPWLGGAGNNSMTHELIWPNFQAMWPLVKTPDGRELQAMGPWGLPLINTVLLVTSGFFLTIAHHALKLGQRKKLLINLMIAILLGVIFMGVQAYEYSHAYHELGLTLNAGIYGTTFFMLTGFHGLHVTIGAIMLFVMWVRSFRGDFTRDNHFAFEAAAWYWHFVDVVWIFLFFVVYWL